MVYFSRRSWPLFQLLYTTHEWELAAIHKLALEKEEFEVCNAIQQEVDKRIENGTINHSLMQGFKRFNPATQTYEGKPMYKGLNGLFKKYHKKGF